jgi:hypothetical protein
MDERINRITFTNIGGFRRKRSDRRRERGDGRQGLAAGITILFQPFAKWPLSNEKSPEIPRHPENLMKKAQVTAFFYIKPFG